MQSGRPYPSSDLHHRAAVAALGEDIRDWPDANPINLQDPAYVGVASMNHQSQPGFTRIRTPYVPDEWAAEIAHKTAHLTADPADLLPTVDLTKSVPTLRTTLSETGGDALCELVAETVEFTTRNGVALSYCRPSIKVIGSWHNPDQHAT